MTASEIRSSGQGESDRVPAIYQQAAIAVNSDGRSNGEKRLTVYVANSLIKDLHNRNDVPNRVKVVVKDGEILIAHDKTKLQDGLIYTVHTYRQDGTHVRIMIPRVESAFHLTALPEISYAAMTVTRDHAEDGGVVLRLTKKATQEKIIMAPKTHTEYTKRPARTTNRLAPAPEIPVFATSNVEPTLPLPQTAEAEAACATTPTDSGSTEIETTEEQPTPVATPVEAPVVITKAVAEIAKLSSSEYAGKLADLKAAITMVNEIMDELDSGVTLIVEGNRLAADARVVEIKRL